MYTGCSVLSNTDKIEKKLRLIKHVQLLLNCKWWTIAHSFFKFFPMYTRFGSYIWSQLNETHQEGAHPSHSPHRPPFRWNNIHTSPPDLPSIAGFAEIWYPPMDLRPLLLRTAPRANKKIRFISGVSFAWRAPSSAERTRPRRSPFPRLPRCSDYRTTS